MFFFSSFFYRMANAPAAGGIRPGTPTFNFWITFFENEPDLSQEFQRRISQSNGYIAWNFLPDRGIRGNQPLKEQYRRALIFVQQTIEKLCVDGHHRNGRLVYLNKLKGWTDRIIGKRERDIQVHDTWFQWFKENIFRLDNTTRNHKEVLKLWLVIRNTIDRGIQRRNSGTRQQELCRI